MRKSQISLLNIPKINSNFGGSHLRSHPKTSRPVSKKSPMHVVLKSDVARGKYSMLYNARRIETHVHSQARHHGIKVLSFVNVGNHLHLMVQLGHRKALQGFLRSLCGVIAKEMRSKRLMGLTGKPSLRKEREIPKNFWLGRPFSRIVVGLKDIKGVERYLFLNELEVFGVSKDEGKVLLAGIQRCLASH
jgi:REP element-mobilizing transposase RayT